MNYAQGAAALGIVAVLFGGDVLTLFRGEQVLARVLTTPAVLWRLVCHDFLVKSGCAVNFQLQCLKLCVVS